MSRRAIIPRVRDHVLVELGASKFWAHVREVRHLGRKTFITVVPLADKDDFGGPPSPYIVTPDSLLEKRSSREVSARG